MSPSDDSGDGDDIVDLVTVYILVWCVYPDGTEDGPWTQTFDVDTIATIGEVIATAEAVAESFCRNAQRRGFGLGPPSDSAVFSWEITAPTYFVYARGL